MPAPTLKLAEILTLAKATQPEFSIELPFINDHQFFDRDLQTIQLDHFDAKQAQEINCDTTVRLVEKRVVTLNGATLSLITKYGRSAVATMNLTTKAVEIQNFERENFNADDSFNSTTLTADQEVTVIDSDEDAVKLTEELHGYDISKYRNSVEPDCRTTASLINGFKQKWLQDHDNTQLLQRLFNSAFDRELYL